MQISFSKMCVAGNENHKYTSSRKKCFVLRLKLFIRPGMEKIMLKFAMVVNEDIIFHS